MTYGATQKEGVAVHQSEITVETRKETYLLLHQMEV